ncbi:GPI-anchored surface protein, putative, partial [Bodo saltans]
SKKKKADKTRGTIRSIEVKLDEILALVETLSSVNTDGNEAVATPVANADRDEVTIALSCIDQRFQQLQCLIRTLPKSDNETVLSSQHIAQQTEDVVVEDQITTVSQSTPAKLLSSATQTTTINPTNWVSAIEEHCNPDKSLVVHTEIFRATKLPPNALCALHFTRYGNLFISESIADTNSTRYKFISRLAQPALALKSLRIMRVAMVLPNGAIASKFAKRFKEMYHLGPATFVKNLDSDASAAAVAEVTFAEGTLRKQFLASHLSLVWCGTQRGVAPEKCVKLAINPIMIIIVATLATARTITFSLVTLRALGRPDPITGETAIIIFAVVVSRVNIITPEADYNKIEDEARPHRHGFSKYHSELDDEEIPIPLAEGCDAHFVPLKDWGYTHPRTGAEIHNVEYQAVDASFAEAHELVVRDFSAQCLPLDIAYLKPEV